MKTIVIWDQCGEAPIKFFVLDGDYSRFNQFYLNEADSDIRLEHELTGIMYDKEGKTKVGMLTHFPVLASFGDEPVTVIVAGFLP